MPEGMQKIIQLPVERDEHGQWTHPAWPDDGEECQLPYSWFSEHGLEFSLIEMEHDGPEDLVEAWVDGSATDCTPWQPSKPAGDGWFIFSIHDTEDGPICVWVRYKDDEQCGACGGCDNGCKLAKDSPHALAPPSTELRNQAVEDWLQGVTVGQGQEAAEKCKEILLKCGYIAQVQP